MLAQRFGVAHIEHIEDAVQSTLMLALENWKAAGVPENPSAWIFRVAHNELIDALRKQTRQQRILLENADMEWVASTNEVEPLQSWEVKDALLRMLFVCCDDTLPAQSQLILALKTLCGFDTREIALRLFISEENVYKRLARARTRLQAQAQQLDQLAFAQYSARLPAVRNIIYTMFTEGYLSSHEEMAIRHELCNEAIRLATLLADHAAGQDAETYALLALLYFHSARITSRQSPDGGLRLLQEQDRDQWDRRKIEIGLWWLAKSAEGDTFSRYHAEAGIAAEHCLAPSLEATHWERIVELYQLLEDESSSPIHKLNRALAVAQWKGPEAGLAILKDVEIPSWLSGSHMWFAVMADLHRRCGSARIAQRYMDMAVAAAPNEAVKTLMLRRFQPSDKPFMM